MFQRHCIWSYLMPKLLLYFLMQTNCVLFISSQLLAYSCITWSGNVIVNTINTFQRLLVLHLLYNFPINTFHCKVIALPALRKQCTRSFSLIFARCENSKFYPLENARVNSCALIITSQSGSGEYRTRSTSFTSNIVCFAMKGRTINSYSVIIQRCLYNKKRMLHIYIYV